MNKLLNATGVDLKLDTQGSHDLPAGYVLDFVDEEPGYDLPAGYVLDFVDEEPGYVADYA
jgi:hypothetical protein